MKNTARAALFALALPLALMSGPAQASNNGQATDARNDVRAVQPNTAGELKATEAQVDILAVTYQAMSRFLTVRLRLAELEPRTLRADEVRYGFGGRVTHADGKRSTVRVFRDSAGVFASRGKYGSADRRQVTFTPNFATDVVTLRLGMASCVRHAQSFDLRPLTIGYRANGDSLVPALRDDGNETRVSVG